MFEQAKPADQVKSIKWQLNNHIWSLNLNLWFKPTSFYMVASCISSIDSILPCHDHASYCCIALIVFFLCLPVLSPLSRRGSDDEFDDTDEDPMLSSEVPGKQNPIEHSDTIPLSRSCSLYYIRTTTLELLHAAVVEPLSTVWPVIATVNSWNPLVWVGVVWAMLCLLIHALWLCLLLLRVVSGLVHLGDGSEWNDHVL